MQCAFGERSKNVCVIVYVSRANTLSHLLHKSDLKVSTNKLVVLQTPSCLPTIVHVCILQICYLGQNKPALYTEQCSIMGVCLFVGNCLCAGRIRSACYIELWPLFAAKTEAPTQASEWRLMPLQLALNPLQTMPCFACCVFSHVTPYFVYTLHEWGGGTTAASSIELLAAFVRFLKHEKVIPANCLSELQETPGINTFYPFVNLSV